MFFKDLGNGIGNFWKAFGFIFKHGLWYYYLFPAVISILLFLGVAYIAESVSDWATNSMMDMLGFEESIVQEDAGWWDRFTGMFKSGVETGVHLIVHLGIIYTGGVLVKYVMLIVLSPVLAFLSEKTEEILTGNEYPFDMRQIMKDVGRGIMIALRNMFIEFGFIILGWIVMFIFPPAGLVITPLLWIIGWYYYGFSMMDYVNERRRLSVGDSVKFVRKHKGIAVGNGWMFALVNSIWFIGPIFAPINACVGAALSIGQVVDLKSNPFAVNKKLEYHEQH